MDGLDINAYFPRTAQYYSIKLIATINLKAEIEASHIVFTKCVCFLLGYNHAVNSSSENQDVAKGERYCQNDNLCKNLSNYFSTTSAKRQ